MDAAQREILEGNLKRVRERIAAACARVKRDPKDVTLIAVTKTVGPEVMQALIELGVTAIGENKLQAAQEKFPKVPALKGRKPGQGEGPAETHFIGHLQTNKVKGVLELFDTIHSVDSLKLVQEIEKRVWQTEHGMFPCFIEVNSGEENKEGVESVEVASLWQAMKQTENVLPVGLMTMAPVVERAENVRPVFQRLRAVFDEIPPDPKYSRWLSMGMSNDFEIAIEEGATHVRIGTALFEGL